MEQQYGEHYAQKVEDRLLLYLHELEAVLPGETYIDKVNICVCLFKRQSHSIKMVVFIDIFLWNVQTRSLFSVHKCALQIMRKESPVTEEEKLLLEVITSNSATIAATLRNLLHCGEKIMQHKTAFLHKMLQIKRERNSFLWNLVFKH